MATPSSRAEQQGVRARGPPHQGREGARQEAGRVRQAAAGSQRERRAKGRPGKRGLMLKKYREVIKIFYRMSKLIKANVALHTVISVVVVVTHAVPSDCCDIRHAGFGFYLIQILSNLLNCTF